MFQSVAPVLFVLVWSTGFIVARGVAPHADVQLFLLLRFTIGTALFGVGATLSRASWPSQSGALRHMAVGATMMGLYLSLSFWAVAQGMPAGVMALMGALQPLLTAAILTVRGQRPSSAYAWSGLSIGLLGVVLVLLPRLEHSRLATSSLATQAGVASIVALTFGTLAQKHLAKEDLRVAGCLQNLGAGLVTLIAAATVGTGQWDQSAALSGLLAWSVLINSVLSQTLLMWMMRRGEAIYVTSLMLMVPPVAALFAYALFHETLTWLQLAGFVLALGGVVLARRTAPSSAG